MRRHDGRHPLYPELLRECPQQRHGHVGFDIVLAHVARVAIVLLQETDHVVHIPGQVGGHCNRLFRTDQRVLGGIVLQRPLLLNAVDQLVEQSLHVGVLQLFLFRGSELVIVTVGIGPMSVHCQGKDQCEQRGGYQRPGPAPYVHVMYIRHFDVPRYKVGNIYHTGARRSMWFEPGPDVSAYRFRYGRSPPGVGDSSLKGSNPAKAGELHPGRPG